MTATVPSPDLQRIVEALKACRERYRIYAGERLDLCSAWDVTAQPLGFKVFQGSPSACHDWRDARCAEAMVRAIVPAELVALSEAATPGKWHVKRIKGYTDDEVFTDHPDFQVKPHGSYIASTGLAAGHPAHRYSEDADLIAASTNLVRSLSAILGETQP